MRLLYFLFVVAICLSSCNSGMDDPLMGFEIGEEEKSWNNNIRSLISQRKLTKKQDDFEVYRMHFTNSGDSIYADIHINPDQYYFGELRSIHFNLAADTTYKVNDKTFYLRATKPRSKEDIEKLFEWFTEEYGTPTDTISIKDSFRGGINEYLNQSLNPDPVQNIMRMNELDPKLGSFVWEQALYKIFFYKGDFDPLNLSFFEEKIDSTRLSDPSIIYQSKDHKADLQSIIDSISKSKSLNDIVKIDFFNPYWERKANGNNTLKIRLSELYVNSPEEVRSINAIKLDITLKNVFDDTIVNIKDTEFYLKEPISFNGGLQYVQPYTFEMEYNRFTKEFQELELAKSMKSGQIKVSYKIKSLVFSDGTIRRE